MSKVTGLKPGAKNFLVVLAIVAATAGVYFGFFKDGQKVQLQPQTEQTSQVATDNSATGATTASSVTTAEGRTFNYTPVDPQGGTYRGVVEVGASGFNAFVIQSDANKNWKLIYKEFGKSLAKEGMATTADIKAGLKDYIATIAEHGVNGKNIHFVVSSGAQQSPNTKVFTDELAKQGYVVNKVTAEQEGKYALKALLPAQFADNSFSVDMGSGNTKINWYEGTELKTIELPGAKYHQDGKSNEEVYQQVLAAAQKVPQDKRAVCFIIGGVPFKLAGQSRNGTERYTVLNTPSNYSPKDKKEEAGINIYKAIQDATKTDTFVFDWDANFTIGYLLGLKG